MRARSLALSITLVSLLSLACAPGGWAVTVRGGTLRAGGRAFLTMQPGTAASSCRLVASGPRRARQLLSRVRLRQRRVEWTWVVPAAASSARWRVQAICGTSRLSTSFVVRGNLAPRSHRPHARMELELARHVRVVQYGGALPHPAQQASAPFPVAVAWAPLPPTVLAQAQGWWVQAGAAIIALFHTGLSAGQCTDYVAAQRPDVVQRVDTLAYGRFLMARGGDLGVDWTARNWLLNAQHAGMSTGRVARLGAVLVFQPGAYGAFSDGHVAIVSAVRRDGSFTISEMHAPAIGQLTTRNFDAATALTMASDPRIGFIYR